MGLMRTRTQPLLCELHAHTRWSDGALDIRELIDLYGCAGFDVLAITDHVVRRDDMYQLAIGATGPSMVHAANHSAYIQAVMHEAERARELYDLLVIPGIELTYNDPDPYLAAHAVAVGCRAFVGMDDGIEVAMVRAREAGAAIIAAHPHSGDGGRRGAGTRRFSRDWQELGTVIDRFELFNGRDLYGWVAEARLPGVANGDFHRPGDLSGWKTLLPCARNEESVVAYLRSERPVYLANVEAGDVIGRIAA